MTSFGKKESSISDISNLLIILAITMLGTFLRWQYLGKGDFILNDGGMFYTMILDLEKNGFVLPEFTSYNISQIPYAYPPLSFYSGAILHDVFNIELVTIFRYYPLLFNILSIPAVYFLAKELDKNDRRAVLATGFYAILFPGFEWLISGGGLTRSPAHLYFIISMGLYLSFLRTRRGWSLITAIIVAALMTLHHIEYCWVLGLSIILFSLFRAKISEVLPFGGMFALGVAVLTAPYWITILRYHGPNPFLSAFAAGEFNPFVSIWRLILLIFTREPMITFINVLAIIGLWYTIASRKYQLPAWLLLIIFFDPRSADRISIFPVVLLAAMAVDQVLLPALTPESLRNTNSTLNNEEKKNNWGGQKFLLPLIFTLFCVLYPFMLAYLQTFTPGSSLTMLTAPQREAMEWIIDNTPDKSIFIVMSPDTTWSSDKVSEWFPALTGRKNLLTVQGAEWLPNSSYLKIQDWTAEAKKSYYKNEDCLEKWRDKYSLDFDYIFIPKQSDEKPFPSSYLILENSFSRSTALIKRFENDGAIVYMRR